MTEMDDLAAALSLEIAEAVMGNPTVEAVFSPDDLDGFKSDIQTEAVRVLNAHFARSRPSLSPAGVTEEQVDAALKAKPRNCTLAQWLDMTHISEAGARELVRAALEAAAKAQPSAASDGWRTDQPPMDGTPIYRRLLSVMRFKPYSPNSVQFRSGDKGRWQEMNEYGGWKNCPTPLGAEWRFGPVDDAKGGA